MNTIKRHSLSVFFVSSAKTILPYLLVLIPSVATATSINPCSYTSHDQLDETVTIDHVYDGDTVKLADGRKLRLIGINTPETASRNKTAQPYANQARHYFDELIKESKTVQIRYGVQKKDRYGRLLAHIFLIDKRNISALMLQKGYARALHMPPNNWQFQCYAQLDKHAQKFKIGLWSNSLYQSIDVKYLKPKLAYQSSYQQISGIVTNIQSRKTKIVINLGAHFKLRINKSSLAYFDKINFDKLVGKTITARGYIVYYPKPKQYRMLLRHPVAMTIR